MPKTTTIELETPIATPSGAIARLILREPTVSEVLTHGEAYSVGYSPQGNSFVVENGEAIAEYARLCLIEPRSLDELEAGGPAVARKLKQAVLDFFLPVSREGEASETSSTTSPSASADASTSSENSASATS